MMVRFISNRGFTLIELIMTIVIGGVIALAVSPLLSQGFSAYFASTIQADMDSQAKLAMERMSREIRQIQDPPSQIYSMQSDRLSFFLTGVGTITYRRSTTSPNTLVRIESNDSDVLATDVSRLSFRYLDYLQNPVFDPGSVKVVEIQFALKYNQAGGIFSRTFRSMVFLRNAT
ncbi:MAG: prepilin-type N-terminal cleavage/methylation domain-containing protein [Thermodesulfobacteriota bacterium]